MRNLWSFKLLFSYKRMYHFWLPSRFLFCLHFSTVYEVTGFLWGYHVGVTWASWVCGSMSLTKFGALFLIYLFNLFILILKYVFFFKKDFISLFLDRGEEKKKERETTRCGCLSHAPYWGPGPQPRHVPWLGIEQATLWFAGQHSIHWATPSREYFFLYFTSSSFQNWD